MSRRLSLLDFLRGVAIFCVVVDHVFAWVGGTVEHSFYHQFFIFSVVPLFFLAGVTFGLSFLKRQVKFIPSHTKNIGRRVAGTLSNYLKYFWGKSQKIIIAYLIGSLIIQLWVDQSFSLQDYFYNLIVFPFQFYFIAIYLQLLFIAPLLAKLFLLAAGKRGKWWGVRIIGTNLLILIVAVIFNQYEILGKVVYEPARFLFGGIELWVFGTGIMLAYLYQIKKIPSFFRSVYFQLGVGVGGIGGLLWLDLQNKIFAHPPNFLTLWYCACGLFLAMVGYQILSKVPLLKMIKTLLVFWGKHSLDIFIFHALFIQKILLYTKNYHWSGTVIDFMILSVSACFLSILLTYVVDKILYFLSKIFQSGKI